ncbi:hypothetical protein ACFE04_031534 [Oxalis oulophora]
MKILFTSLLLIHFTVFTSATTDITDFIYKGCANQDFQNPTQIQDMNTLLTTLVSNSSQKTFFTSKSGDTTGLFQCRGDLSLTDCHTCVSKIPSLLQTKCGNTIAARVQLSGCYLKYEVFGFTQVSGTELLYKVCGPSDGGGSGFEEKRESAFNMGVSGVKSSGGGLFYTGNFESFYVLGQCEGDLSNGDCGDCVKSGFGSVEKECGDSINAQLYLNKCYVSFSYYPDGVPKISDDPSSSGAETKKQTQRTIAIVVGGMAAVGFLVVVLMFVVSVMKKKSSSSKHGGWN